MVVSDFVQLVEIMGCSAQMLFSNFHLQFEDEFQPQMYKMFERRNTPIPFHQCFIRNIEISKHFSDDLLIAEVCNETRHNLVFLP